MFNRKHFTFFALWFIVLVQPLFSQIILQGTVTDNGAEHLGSGAEAVVNVLVTVIDQAAPSRSFRSYTNEQGKYSIEITQIGVVEKAEEFRLLQNYPNPFNPSTVLRYELPQPCHVTIHIYSVLGRKVKTLLDGYQNSSGQVVWDATDDTGNGVSAGVYIYSLEVNGSRMVRKMTLVDGHHDYKSINLSNATASGTLSQNGVIKQSADLYMLRITGENIETYEQRDLTITTDLVLDVSVIRTVTDIDGNVYRTVKIGDQWWLMENLKVTHYRNGNPIEKNIDQSQWFYSKIGAWTVYDGNLANKDTYGLLYNGYAVNDDRHIAPAGWHVPTDEEWKQLEMALGMSREEADKWFARGTDEGGKMKQIGTAHWNSPNTGATNKSGFSALPGGSRSFEGFYYSLGSDAYFWSSTKYDNDHLWYRHLDNSHASIGRKYNRTDTGFSVRCVKDRYTTNTPPTASFTVSPSIGTTHTDFLFDASGSYDSEDDASTLLFLWDWGNDGIWDTFHSTNKTVTHRYNTTGTKTIKLQVKDSGGLKTTTTRQVTVSHDSGGETVTDIDGNVYRIVKIGDQWWMAENLKVTHYRNGDAIPNMTSSDWGRPPTGACCAYGSVLLKDDTYGLLYNWYAVNDSRNIAPAGWHVASDEDWKQLEMYLGMSRSDADTSHYPRGTNQGSKLAGNASLWENGALTNNSEFGTSGFSALPAGYYGFGWFSSRGSFAYFWSSNEHNSHSAWGRAINNGSTFVYRGTVDKEDAQSVRCVRD